VVAQRLVKRICESCKTAYEPNDMERKRIHINNVQMIYKGKGCIACNHTGYRGRIAIHEIMPITQDLKSLIDQKESIDVLRRKSIEEGMITLRVNCTELVVRGITTMEELLKVTFSMD